MTTNDTQAPLDGWPEGIELRRRTEVRYGSVYGYTTWQPATQTWLANRYGGEIGRHFPTETAAVQAILEGTGINAAAASA